MYRLLFIIRSLNIGGAERQLLELVRRIDAHRFRITVVTLREGGELRGELERVPHVTVVSLAKRSRWHVLRPVWRLWRIARRLKPHIVHGYMGVANELALVMGRLIGARVVWGIRASNVEPQHYGWLTGALARCGAFLSPLPDLIIVNSVAGRDHHLRSGFPSDRMLVIPNGIDTEAFAPDPAARRTARVGLGVGDDECVIGLVGRLDPMKDHETFLQAAAALSAERKDIHFLCVGGGAPEYAGRLYEQSLSLDLGNRVHWLGSVRDMRSIYNAMDLLTLCSAFGEGFSNAVGEAMACGVPCVVTDVGDARLAVGNTGVIVPVRNPARLVEAWRALLRLSPRESQHRRAAARARIVEHFGAQRMATETARALWSLVAPAGTPEQQSGAAGALAGRSS